MEIAFSMYNDGMSFSQANQVLPIGSYPSISNVLAFLIHHAGLSSLILYEPYLLLLLIFIPLSLTFLFNTEKSSENTWIHALVLLFPVTHLATKSLSWHTFCVFYAFIGVLHFLEWRKYKSNHSFILSIFFLTLSVAFKHLGVIQLLALIMSFFMITPQINRDKGSLLILISPLFFALPFYLINPSAFEYLNFTLTHNHAFNEYGVLLLISLGVSTLVMFKYMLRNTVPSHSDNLQNKLHFRLFPSLLFFSFFNYILFHFLQSLPSTIGTVFIPIFMSGLALLLLHHKEVHPSRMNNFSFIFVSGVIQLSIGVFLFHSKLGHLHAIFQLPILLSLVYWIKASKNNVKVYTVFVFILWGNFFPGEPSRNLQASFWSQQIAALFHTTTQNPWNWKKSSFRSKRKEFQKLAEGIIYQNERELFCLTYGLDEYQDRVFNIYNRSHMFLTGILCNSRIQWNLLEDWHQHIQPSNDESRLNVWLNEGAISIIYDPYSLKDTKEYQTRAFDNANFNPSYPVKSKFELINWILSQVDDNSFKYYKQTNTKKPFWIHRQEMHIASFSHHLQTYMSNFSKYNSSINTGYFRNFIQKDISTKITANDYTMIQTYFMKHLVSDKPLVFFQLTDMLSVLWPKDESLNYLLNFCYQNPLYLPNYYDLKDKSSWKKLHRVSSRAAIQKNSVWYPLFLKIQKIINQSKLNQLN